EGLGTDEAYIINKVNQNILVAQVVVVYLSGIFLGSKGMSPPSNFILTYFNQDILVHFIDDVSLICSESFIRPFTVLGMRIGCEEAGSKGKK
ncbi:MAG: hypothetical protein AAFV78_05900, partial [Bacteroidota bacterium]